MSIYPSIFVLSLCVPQCVLHACLKNSCLNLLNNLDPSFFFSCSCFFRTNSASQHSSLYLLCQTLVFLWLCLSLHFLSLSLQTSSPSSSCSYEPAELIDLLVSVTHQFVLGSLPPNEPNWASEQQLPQSLFQLCSVTVFARIRT